ncbi:oligopeptide transport protein [Lactobacillus selangorensis]|uniref:Oligopeptide transport protein n=1 Tax=Lactobacillus selangorensis TaxID=81857 RepID=A0A0R2FXI8_9LACO|nr:oligopeptide ABC transporter permease [Lactobacillus selangorensis]KRN29636.1 oligopeptide transport protein [Lactobacillus selangorensis]KRN33835.1 oligopeptide transport protein [Lactobacillus selangorensis]
MWKTILRRVLLMIPQIIILSLMVFMLAKMMPGDPFTGLVTPQTDPSQLHRLRVEAGFYNPWYVQYRDWVVNMFHGNFGTSYQYHRSVASMIGERAVNTFWLALLTFVLTYLIAIPVGIIAGRYESSWKDNAIQVYTYITLAIPAFVFYLFGIWLFGYVLGWFPTSGSISVSATGMIGKVGSMLYHMILPALLAAILATTSIIQYLRSGIIDNKQEDYVRTARSKGVPERVVFSKHILRNSFLPIAAFIGNNFAVLIGGSVFTETIFSYPGLGQLFISSISSRDYSIITALVLIFGIFTLLGNLISDIILRVVDPRLRIQ